MPLKIVPLQTLDWVIIFGYAALLIMIGLYFSRRASGSLMEYFVAGRKLTWWVAGTSIVATSFAADTPLVISGWMRTTGLQRNWFWWSGILAMMLCTFFYARLWRRAKILTDIEFTELRYHGKAAAFLRVFHAMFRATIQNCLIIGWVILAGSLIIEVVLDLPTVVILKDFSFHTFATKAQAISAFSQDQVFLMLTERIIGVAFCMCISLTYSTISGVLGIMVADFVQFTLAMVGAILFAYIVVAKCGGPIQMIQDAMALLREGAVSNGTTPYAAQADQLVRFSPPLDMSAGKLAVFSFFVIIGLNWIGGGQGGGFLAQRLFSCKNEKHSVLAMLWYNFMHFVVRPWPWILVGIGSIVLIPELEPGMNQEYAYPIMLMSLLPVGLKGIVVASLIAAFMSTMDTHLNFGSSYLVNDIYKRFIAKDKTQAHYVRVSKIAVILVALLSVYFASQYKTISNAWFYFTEIMAGAGLVVLLRWYWWRINVWSELSAMISSLTISNVLRWIPAMNTVEDMYAVRLMINIVLSTTIWVTVTFMTKPESEEHLSKFYKRVAPGGWWGPIAAKHPEVHGLHVGSLEVANLFLGIACIFTALFGVGWLVMGHLQSGLLILALSIFLGFIMLKLISKMDWEGMEAIDQDT